MLGSFSIWNSSDRACLLDGTPEVAVVDAAGHDLRVRDRALSQEQAGPILLPAGQNGPIGATDPRTAGSGYVETQFLSLCGISVAPGALSLVVTLPEGGRLRARVLSGLAPECIPVLGSSFAVGPFRQVPASEPTEPPPVPAEALSLSLEVPPEVTAGRLLDYVAVLTNLSGQPVPLAPCPAYQESLSGGRSQVTLDFLLDCGAAPQVGVGQTVRFAIVLPVPASFLPGDAALIWQLDPYHSQGLLPRQPAEKLTLRVVAP